METLLNVFNYGALFIVSLLFIIAGIWYLSVAIFNLEIIRRKYFYLFLAKALKHKDKKELQAIIDIIKIEGKMK